MQILEKYSDSPEELGRLSGHIVDQFLESEPEDLEFQDFREVYSVLSEIDNYSGENRQRLIDHLDDYAEDVPVRTPDSSYGSFDEMLESLTDYFFRRGRFIERSDLDFESERDVLDEQVRTFLGDRLRYIEESEHSK